VRIVRIVLVPIAVALGVALLLLADDVRSWHSVLGSGAVAAGAAPGTASKPTASTSLPSGLSASLLDVGLDRRWLVAAHRFRVAHDVTFPKYVLTAEDYRLLNGAEDVLARLTQDSNRARASRAYTLLAVLVFREAYPGTVVVRRLVQESLTDEQNAVRLDPSNDAAKEDLELTLRVLVSVSLAPQQARAAGTRRANAKQGGYEGPPGAGY
jgi:hypothetical protein